MAQPQNSLLNKKHALMIQDITCQDGVPLEYVNDVNKVKTSDQLLSMPSVLNTCLSLHMSLLSGLYLVTLHTTCVYYTLSHHYLHHIKLPINNSTFSPKF